MAKIKYTGIEEEIDELTNSIRNVITGDSFPTDILGATHFGGRLMIINTEAALNLIHKYFTNII